MSTLPPMAPELRRTIKRRLLCPFGPRCVGRRCNAVHTGRPAVAR